MRSSDSPSDRFRSATEFPKAINTLDPVQANALYQEMRDCLIFTNRSRSQLLRRNEEHKQSAIQLRTDVQRLQNMLAQLKTEKEQLADSNRQIVTELDREITTMAGHLDQLSKAFDAVADIDSPGQSQWGYLATPGRFFNFLRAIKAIVLWWREEKGQEPATIEVKSSVSPPMLSSAEIEEDKREKPQMYTDSASQGRSLLDR